MCAGQVEGGTLQALGWGGLEEIKMKDGRFLNDRLQTYIIPTMADTPDMETILLENPTGSGPFGAKGVGELPMDGGAAALLQAIENATGLSLAAIPATPERIFEASRAKGKA
jgi:CO/xanthine dehydrogenase Mo-binding subunit